MTRDEMLEVLSDERDRLDDELTGLAIAQQAACSPATLAVLLVPGFGAVVYTTARAACRLLEEGELDNRIASVENIIEELEDLGRAISSAPDEKLPELEQRVRTVVAGLRDVNPTDSLFDDAAAAVRGAIDDARSVAGVGGAILRGLFSPFGLIAMAGVGLAYASSRR